MFQILDPSVTFDAVEDALFRTLPLFACYDIIFHSQWTITMLLIATLQILLLVILILPEDVKRSLSDQAHTYADNAM